MHIISRLKYIPYVYANPGETEKITETEALNRTGSDRLNHAAALFFAISRMDIDARDEPIDPELLNSHIRSLGELGNLICDGAFGDFATAIENLEDCIKNRREADLKTDLDAAPPYTVESGLRPTDSQPPN